MTPQRLLLLTSVGLAGLFLSSVAQAQNGVALTGKVISEQEPTMEGVLVSAKLDGSNVTTTVVTNAQGVYSFPADKLAPGHYAIAIRAIGYKLDGPKAVDVSANAATTADIKLNKTNALANQMSNGEWLQSLPGDDKIKAALTNCVGCHTVQRIVQSTHDAAEFMQLFKRMGTYSPGSTPTHPQPLLQGGNNSESCADPQVDPGEDRRLSRQHQSQQCRDAGFPAQAAAASEGSFHPRHHHRIRPAAQRRAAP